MKRMLFNATQAEELRVAIVDGQKLIDLDIESAAKEQRKSNIYKGVITRIEPSLEACFVDYGAERHGFLPFKEVSRSYFQPGVEPGRVRINEALKEGQQVIVQVDKDERGNKGAALTTFVSLAGRYLVLMPNNPRGGGVSRRVDGDERAELREQMDQLEVPQGMSLIARTAAIGRQAEELQWDLNYLLQLWRAIEGVAREQDAPLLIYQEGSLVIRAIRDYFQPEIGEILIDTPEVFEQAQAFMGQVMPGNVNRVKLYRDDVPLFSRFQIEHQIETAFARQVNLPSGGAIVIDHTEALVAIDVNSGRATKGADIEETATKTNQEAADEIARQLRLRDLGGLIVIDFIDMENPRNQREVENRLRDALRFDRARVQMGKISRFGLMELSRQRLRPALAETSYIPCPRCTGTGHIRSTESAALHILRILEEEAMKENTSAVHAQVPVDVATFLLNEKRADINAIELRQRASILLIPNIHLETPAHTITRIRQDESVEEGREPSYKMVELPTEDSVKLPSTQPENGKPRQEAAIKNITPQQPAPVVADKPAEAVAPAPVVAEAAKPGLFSRIMGWFKSEPAPVAPPPAPVVPEAPKGKGQRDGGRNNRRDRGERGEREERGERGEGNRNNRRNNRRDERRDDENRNERGERPQRDAKEARDNQNRESRENREPRNNTPRNERNNQERAERNDIPATPVSAEGEVQARPPREPRERRPRRERNYGNNGNNAATEAATPVAAEAVTESSAVVSAAPVVAAVAAATVTAAVTSNAVAEAVRSETVSPAELVVETAVVTQVVPAQPVVGTEEVVETVVVTEAATKVAPVVLDAAEAQDGEAEVVGEREEGAPQQRRRGRRGRRNDRGERGERPERRQEEGGTDLATEHLIDMTPIVIEVPAEVAPVNPTAEATAAVENNAPLVITPEVIELPASPQPTFIVTVADEAPASIAPVQPEVVDSTPVVITVAAEVAPPAPVVSEAVSELVVVETLAQQPVQASLQLDTPVEVIAPAASADVFDLMAPAEVTPVIEAPRAVAVLVTAPAKVAAPALSVDDALAASGLVLVQTTAPVQPLEMAPPKLGRTPRRAPVMQDEGPLQMVETGKS